MLFVRYLLIAVGVVLFGTAAALVSYDVYLAIELERLLRRGGEAPARPRPARSMPGWRSGAKLAALALLPLLLGLSVVVVPEGMAGVRISQISGVHPGTLYPGVHFVVALVERLALLDVRDHVFTTAIPGEPRQKAQVLQVEAREGLRLGLGIVVRYRLDPRRLDYIESNLPQPIDEKVVAPVVSSVFHDVAPNYVVREIFATKRQEFRERAAGMITARLAGDAIVVKEVLLRQVQLPEEYAKGLEGLLLKEQEDERMGVETDIQQKQVRIAELQADAAKVRAIKRAEADGQAHVIAAKAESDAMQYTLPLKQKQIEQTRLEAQARKEATIQNAEAAAQAKVTDSKAEAERIRLISAAEAEKMKMEALVLKANPLLIQKIIAERLSDKVQIMMVPTDGKFFFTQDVLRSAPITDPSDTSSKDMDDPPRKTGARP